MYKTYLSVMFFVATCLSACIACHAQENNSNPDQLPAFPGAEGYGAVARGGRGGKVLIVTTLESKGPGSFRWAVEQSGPRIVTFAVSGVIPGKYKIYKPKMTIAGQTAPGAGITIDGNIVFNESGNDKISDYIVRFIRVRPDFHGAHASGGDCIRTHGKPVILDHVSVSWSTDEAIQSSGGGTIQWCATEATAIAWEGHQLHAYGPFMYACPFPQTMHHTLIAHAMERVPLAGGPFLDFRNCVVYNCWHTSSLGKSNAVNNYMKTGPGGPQGMRPNLPPIRPGKCRIGQSKRGVAYARGNVLKPLKGPLEKLPDRGTEPLPAPKVTTHSAEEAYELVMAHAGCLPRDAVSKKTFREARTGTGFMGRYVPEGGLMEGLTPGSPPKDTDKDGIPDTWEKAHNLDPSDLTDNSKIVPAGISKNDRHKGYTYIEYYINELADNLIEQAIAEARLQKE